MKKQWLIASVVALTLTGLGFRTARAAEAKEENEQKIKFKDAPAAVRKTLKREANGEAIATVDKEKLDGKTVYEADVVIDGHNYEIVVDPKGMLLSKKLDLEEDGDKPDAKTSSKAKAGKKGSEDKEDADDDKPASKAKGKVKAQKEDKDDDDDSASSKVKAKGKADKQDNDDSDDEKAVAKSAGKAKAGKKDAGKKDEADDDDDAKSSKVKGKAKAKKQDKQDEDDDK